MTIKETLFHKGSGLNTYADMVFLSPAFAGEREREHLNLKTLILKNNTTLCPFGLNSQSLLHYKHK